MTKIKRNRPNIVVKNYKRKICLLIDETVPSDNDISVKEYNKISLKKWPGNRKWKNVSP